MNTHPAPDTAPDEPATAGVDPLPPELHRQDPNLQRCLSLAERAVGLSEPNPRVGCVIVTPQGHRFEGHTHEAGGPHAEAHAIGQAQAQGVSLKGATAWVSLEPCSHQGRTPPCSLALIGAGIARVHVAGVDPNPLVSGRGIEQLRQAGIEVILHEDEWSAAARQLNIGFHSRMVRGRPWVRMKVAASLDGTTALLNGRSQWITGEAARHDGHAWRRRAAAILTGIGTVRDDDPRLDVRHHPVARQPLRVVVDSRLETPVHARILQSPGRCLLYAAAGIDAQRAAVFSGLEGVELAELPAIAEGPSRGKTDLQALMADLGRRGINELHVEAGEKLNGSLLREGVVDEVLLYLAPRLLGRGRGLAAFASEPLASLEADVPLTFLEARPIGPDLRVRAVTAAGASFLAAGAHLQS